MAQSDLKLVIAVARTHSMLFGNIEESLKQYGLSLSEFGVLELLYHKGRHPVQAVAEKILVTSGTITYVIDKLCKKGLVERKQCSEDKRRFYVELTEEGSVLIAKLFPIHENHLEKIFKGIDTDTKEQLIRNLFELTESIKK